MTFTPANLVANRTARLVAEATTPVYSTDTAGAAAKERLRKLEWAEEFTHSEDDRQPWCHVCSRPTDHFGEHSDEQLLAFYNGQGRKFRR
ncbi:MAG TPA: hypothetical protein VN039_06340 [Nitrospira sp.]|nr:hypothetical protein [Nitrospira sp.]